MFKIFSRVLSEKLDLYPLQVGIEESAVMALEAEAQAVSRGEAVSEYLPKVKEDEVTPRTMRVFFPDMGAAVLARRDWKLGSPSSELPPCIITANVQNDDLSDTDEVAVIVCPLSYEADYVKRVIDLCDAKKIPCVMINPNLINMDQGT